MLATSYLAEVFEPYFGDGSSLGLHIEYVTEQELRSSTGGAIRNVAPKLSRGRTRPVLIFNGDIRPLDIRPGHLAHRLRGGRLPPPDPGGRPACLRPCADP